MAVTAPASAEQPTKVSCSLPITAHQNSKSANIIGGQAALPKGTFVQDHHAGTQPDGGVFAVWNPLIKEWLPGYPQDLSKNDVYYTYASYSSEDTEIHIVNVKTKKDVMAGTVKGMRLVSLGFGADGFIYGPFPFGNSSSSDFYWSVNPQSPKPRQLSFSGTITASVVEGPNLFGYRTNATGASVIQINIHTGVEKSWKEVSNTIPVILGLDSQGHPLVNVFSDSQFTLLELVTPTQEKILLQGKLGAQNAPSSQTLTDKNGTWIPTLKSGVYLLDQQAHLTKYAITLPKGAQGITLAGPCQ